MEGRLVPARRQCEVEVTLISYRIEFGGREERERKRDRKEKKTEKEKGGSGEIREEAEASTASEL